jgi:hypothetical protein
MEMKKSAFALVAGTTMALTTAVMAQPAVDLDLGVLTNPQLVSGTVTIAPNEVKWVKFEIPSMTRAAAQYLDIYTNGGTLVDTFPRTGDTHIGLYNSAGTFIASNDDTGPGFYSQLSFGDTSPARAAIAPTGNAADAGGTRTGTNGADLPAGIYYLAVSNYSHVSGTNTYGAGWAVTSNHNGTGDAVVSIELGTDAVPTSPTMTAVATPNSGIVGATTLLTATVLPGTFPTSTGIVVTGDLTAIGGSATQTFFDNGTNGDVTAGDNIYSYSATVGAVAGGAKVLPISLVDAQARTATANIDFFVSAAPSVFTDLGDVTCTGITQTFDIAAGEVKWFKMTIPAINDAPNYFADFWTNSTGTLADTEIGLYDNSGAIIDFDDDSGNGAKSMLTFGDTVNIRPDADGFDFDLDGFNGTLAGGTYWLAVGAFNTTYLTGWNATSTATATGTIDLRANIEDPSCITAPTNPTGVGSGGVVSGCGGNTLATVTVTGGLNPASTGITVSLDTTALGGGSVAMLDNGTGGDVTAGDNIFSATVAVGGGADAVIALPFTVSDAEARSSGGSLNVTRSGTEIGDLPATAQKYYGLSGSTIAGAMTAGDADMYAICVNDTAAFDATTIGGGPAFDSQLFLFNADGTGALMSDDDLAVAGFSRINAAAAAEPDYDLVSGGLYYLAVSAYNKDPITSGVATDTIWANQNNLASFLGTYGANGVTPTAPIAGWTTGGTANVAYTITMTGATTICPADLSGGTAGVPDCAVDINDLLYFLSAFEAGNADVDNGSGTGALDCATDINDLLFFLTRFEAGC